MANGLDFVVLPRERPLNSLTPGVCYLRIDNWDDYTFRTLFDLLVVTADGIRIDVGQVKIMTRDMSGGRVSVPPRFKALSDEFCSIGQDQNYYEQLIALPQDEGLQILTALRDCVADQDIWEKFRNEKAMGTSLLRSISTSSVQGNFRNIVRGVVSPSPFNFSFSWKNPDASSGGDSAITIDVQPSSIPPTNVHVVIGRNGVGKTRLLAGIVNEISESSSEKNSGLRGRLEFASQAGVSQSFANLVTVAFSAFDRFVPLARVSGDIRYTYVGLKVRSPSKRPHAYSMKSPEDLTEEFSAALSVCLVGPRRLRWIEAIKTLNTDPGFAELQLEQIDVTDIAGREQVIKSFDTLSSGHKIVLLTTTRLVELVDEKSLVLLDEPESHLHPPLLSSFVRALSNLLVTRNGVAIIATHSPVVLQEVPRSCVWLMRRTGEFITAERPSIETFAENVGVLTREVFQLEVTESGFHRLIRDACDGGSVEDVLGYFSGQLGAEGEALVRILCHLRKTGV